jgi:uncharacterized membrane protein required for colicin V production
MNPLDLVIGVLLALGALLGLRRGLLRLLLAATSLAVGWMLALLLHRPLAARLFGQADGWPGLAAFLLVLVVVVAGLALFGRQASRWLAGAGLGWLDRGAGAAVGLGGAAAVSAALLLTVTAVVPRAESRLLEGSHLAPPLLTLGHTLVPMAAASLAEAYRRQRQADAGQAG